MGSYNFKSSGQTQTQRIVETLRQSPVPIGIKTPLRPGSTEGVFAMHFNLADAVHDNLRNLLLTNFGERLGIYNFGANLRPLTTEFVSQDNFDAEAVQRIKSAIAQWMPYVEPEDYISTVNHNDNKNTAVINITVVYNIAALSVKKRALQITLYVI